MNTEESYNTIEIKRKRTVWY